MAHVLWPLWVSSAAFVNSEPLPINLPTGSHPHLKKSWEPAVQHRVVSNAVKLEKGR